MSILVVLTIFLPLSLVLSVCSLFFYVISGESDGSHVPISPFRWLVAFLIPIFMVQRALKKRNLDKSGAVAALVVGFVLTLSNACFCASLLVFFLSASKATKFRSKLKEKLEEDYVKGSQRNWIQVICNGGVATQAAFIFMMEAGCGEFIIDFSRSYTISWLCLAVMGSIACCCGDTFASELGTVIGSSQPRLITNLKKVPKGTNGGISVVGSIMSFFGGAAVGLAYYAALLLCMDAYALEHCPPQWPVVLVGGLAGFLGSMVDSLLGATLQYSGFDEEKKRVVEAAGPHVTHISGCQILDNHSVNLISSFLLSLLTPKIALMFWPLFPGH